MAWVLVFSQVSLAQKIDLKDAEDLRKDIEALQSPFAHAFSDFLKLPKEQLELNVSPVLSQGNTQFCWAFAAYHTLRTYYYNVVSADTQWKTFLGNIDSSSKYKAWVLEQVGSTEIGGWPNEAVMFYEKSMGIQEERRWASYVPSETLTGWQDHPGPDLHPYTPKGYFMPLTQIAQRIKTSLTLGAPTAFCTPVHCVTIYGGTYSAGSAIQYVIADSATGDTYQADATKVHSKIADITTLWN